MGGEGAGGVGDGTTAGTVACAVRDIDEGEGGSVGGAAGIDGGGATGASGSPAGIDGLVSCPAA